MSDDRRPGLSRLLVVLGAVGLVALLRPAGAVLDPTDLPPCVGVQFHAMWSDYDDAERIEVLDKLAAAGIEWIRMDFGWSSVEPRPGAWATWYLERADLVVDAARARGIKVLMSLGRTPSWANGGRDVNVPPTDFTNYAAAARYLAGHFRGRVSAWGVYNEPNISTGAFWTGTAADYARLLQISYDSFKIGDPAAKVVAGHVVYSDDGWIRQMYRAGAADHFDVLATHPYQGVSNEPPAAPDNGTKWRMTHTPAVRDVMCEFGDCDKELWFTEFGWSAHRSPPNAPNWKRGVSEAEQAAYLVETIEQVRRRYPYVTNVFWYRERNGATGDPQLDNYGLMRRDLTPKPAYRSLQRHLRTSDRRTHGISRCEVSGLLSG